MNAPLPAFLARDSIANAEHGDDGLLPLAGESANRHCARHRGIHDTPRTEQDREEWPLMEELAGAA